MYTGSMVGIHRRRHTAAMLTPDANLPRSALVVVARGLEVGFSAEKQREFNSVNIALRWREAVIQPTARYLRVTSHYSGSITQTPLPSRHTVRSQLTFCNSLLLERHLRK